MVTVLSLNKPDINLTRISKGSAAWGDYDNDGDLDILMTGNNSFGTQLSVSKIYHNNGDNTFTEQTGISLTGVMNSSVAWGDYDNDGDLDILMTGYYNDGTIHYISRIYRNNGDNTFTEQTGINLDNVANSSVAWGDFDNDGDQDILLAGQLVSGGVISKIYRNNGNNTFTEVSDISLTGVGYGSVAWGDYDNDGDLDILITGQGTGSTIISKVYRNNAIMKAGDYQANKMPAPPRNLVAVARPDGMMLTWSSVKTDETPSITMTYNINISAKQGDSIAFPAQADTVNGYRRVVAMGNTQLDTSYIVKNLMPGKYYWKVQAVDQGYKGGEWSAGGAFEAKSLRAFFSADTVCTGSNTNFINSSTAYGDVIQNYAWNFGDGTTSSLQNPTHVFTTSGLHNVRLVVSSATNSDTLINQVLTFPTPVTDFSSSVACQGSETILDNLTSTSGLNITGWLWDFGDGKGSILQNPGSHGYLSAGDYKVTLSAMTDKGCSDTIQKTVAVGAYPVAVISASAPLTFCKGDSVNLSVSFNKNYSYKWMIDGTSQTGGDSSKYIAKLSGKYSVEVVNATGNCKTTSSESTVTALNAPVSPLISAGGPIKFCQGDSVVLSVTSTTGYSYQWKKDGGAVGTDQNTIAAKSSGTYSIVVTTSSGCSASSTNTIAVVVYPKPTIPAVDKSGPITFCQGGSVELSVINNPSYTYQWENNGAIISGDTTNAYIAQNSGVYSLKISNSDGCISKTETVTVNTLPTPSAPAISSASATTFCQGDSVTLSVTSTTGYSYQWKKDGGAVGTDQNTISAKSSGAYSLVVTNSSGCSANSTNTINVVANPKPTVPAVDKSGPTTFCQGVSVKLSVINNPSYTYQWENNGAIISGDTTNAYIAQNSGVYSLKISNSFGCISKTETVTVSTLPTPLAPSISAASATTFCQGDSVSLSATNTAGYSYQWKKNGGAVGANSYQVTAKSAGSYNLVVSNSSGCSAASSN